MNDGGRLEGMSESTDYCKQRRNTYGEAPHAARKAIPRGKQRQSQKERRAVREAISTQSQDVINEVVHRARTRQPFKKVHDEPIGRIFLRRGIRQFVQGRIDAAAFRSRMEPLRRAYPNFVVEFCAVYRSLTIPRLPPRVAAVLAEYA
jgi:hypothetical protein